MALLKMYHQDKKTFTSKGSFKDKSAEVHDCIMLKKVEKNKERYKDKFQAQEPINIYTYKNVRSYDSVNVEKIGGTLMESSFNLIVNTQGKSSLEN